MTAPLKGGGEVRKPSPDERPESREVLTRRNSSEQSNLRLQEIMKSENKIQEGETCVYPLPFGLKSLERKTSRQGGGIVAASQRELPLYNW